MPKYSVEKRVPSSHVDKNLLMAIEDYFKKIAEEYKISGFIIKILDSNGTEELPSIKNFGPDYFPNDVRNISINCGNYNAKLSVVFDRKKEKSKLEISIMGDQAREKASRIDAEVMRMIGNYNIKNYIFHIISPRNMMFITFITISAALVMTLLLLRNMILTNALILGIILLMEIIYAIFSYLNTYTTFKTKNYESYMGWKNWLTFALIEFLLFGVGGAVLLKHLGF
jgi:L-rhamnose mutarotase